MSNWDILREVLKGKSALEVGGPSELFKDGYPTVLYDIITPDFLIEKQSAEEGFGQNLVTNNKVYYGDCTEKADWDSTNKSYELILSSHVLEHIANPIKFLKLAHEKTSQFILTIVPLAALIWDKHRPITTIEHIMSDYTNNTSENDQTHLADSYCPAHPWYKHKDHSFKFFDNAKYRAIHHHVFDPPLIQTVHEKSGFQAIAVWITPPHHLVYFGRKI
jgi:hypothetical protein